jgi:adenylate cyclase
MKQGSSSKSKTDFAEDEILQQLNRILDSPDFNGTKQQRAFLTYVVSQTLAGNSRNIKGYTIATEVFGRNEDFDQAIDPIVSIQANKLRRALERYYLLAGREDGILIEIPRGTYVPVFTQRISAAEIPAFQTGRDADNGLEDSWPKVLIKTFRNLTNSPDKQYLGSGFAAVLASEISRFQSFCVLRYGPEGRNKRGTDIAARFVVDGDIWEDETGLKLVVNLIDARHNRQIWSDTHWFAGDPTQIIAYQEEVAAIVGAKVAGEEGIIPRILSSESQSKPPTQMQTYEAILQYHEYEQTHAPQNFLRALDALENARTREPECGQVWTFLARLHANIFSLEIPGFDTDDSEAKALRYAERGARQTPDNQSAILTLAYVRMLHGDIPAARRDIDVAYRLNPKSLYMMDALGYIMTLLGEWERGPALIRKVIRLNPFYKPVVHYALWADCLRQQDFEAAWLETTGLRRPAIFWYPLTKAASLGLLGRIDEGKRYAAELLELKPDFKHRGHWLLRRYIKFDDIADRVIDGLHKAGIEID